MRIVSCVERNMLPHGLCTKKKRVQGVKTTRSFSAVGRWLTDHLNVVIKKFIHSRFVLLNETVVVHQRRRRQKKVSHVHQVVSVFVVVMLPLVRFLCIVIIHSILLFS